MNQVPGTGSSDPLRDQAANLQRRGVTVVSTPVVENNLQGRSVAARGQPLAMQPQKVFIHTPANPEPMHGRTAPIQPGHPFTGQQVPLARQNPNPRDNIPPSQQNQYQRSDIPLSQQNQYHR